MLNLNYFQFYYQISFLVGLSGGLARGQGFCPEVYVRGFCPKPCCTLFILLLYTTVCTKCYFCLLSVLANIRFELVNSWKYNPAKLSLIISLEFSCHKVLYVFLLGELFVALSREHAIFDTLFFA